MPHQKLLFIRARIALAALLALALVACAIGVYVTRGTAPTSVAAPSARSPVDQRMLQTALQLSAFADTTQEQALSAEAMRLSDHELDQAFTSALREVAAPSLPSKGPLKELADRVAGWNTAVAADQKRLGDLQKNAGSNAAPSDALDLAKAQLELDQDELEDAHLDLAHHGGDPQQAIERELEEHEATQHKPALTKLASAPATATVSDQIRAWFALADRQQQLASAKSQALTHVSTLEKEHQTLEAVADHKQAAQSASSPSSPDDDSGEADTLAALARIRRLSDQRKAMSDIDKRVQDSQQLADVYTRWATAVTARQKACCICCCSRSPSSLRSCWRWL